MKIKEIEEHIVEHISYNGHSVISPSWSKTWMSCEGSVYGMSHWRQNSQDNEKALEGTCGHFFLEAALTHSVHPEHITKVHMEFLHDDIRHNFERSINKEVNPNSISKTAYEYMVATLTARFDEEMVYHIGKCYDKIQRYVKKGYTLKPEGKVSLRRLLGHSQCDGISDVKLTKGDHLVIVDLKYGVVVPVIAENNNQLMIYAAPSITPHIKKVTLVIMQPRVEGHEWLSWDTSAKHILEFVEQQVKPKSMEALKVIVSEKAPDYNPTVENCKYCGRRMLCEYRVNKVLEIMARIMRKIDNQDLPSLTEEALSKILLDAPFVQTYIKECEAEALKRLVAKKHVSGFKLVQGRRTRSWTSEKLMLKKAREMGLTADQIYNLKTKSVPQIEKTRSLSKHEKLELMKLGSVTYGKQILANVHDTRKPFDKMQEAVKLFKENS